MSKRMSGVEKLYRTNARLITDLAIVLDELTISIRVHDAFVVERISTVL